MTDTNPFKAPKSRVLNDDDKVIELLLRFKNQMKVMNMLRAEGLTADEAKAKVESNAKVAKSMLAKREMGRTIAGWFLIILGVLGPLYTWFALGYFYVWAIAPIGLGLYILQGRDKITY